MRAQGRGICAVPAGSLSPCYSVLFLVSGLFPFSSGASDLWEQVALSTVIVVGKGALLEHKPVEGRGSAPDFISCSLEVHVAQYLKGAPGTGETGEPTNAAGRQICTVADICEVETFASLEDKLKKKEPLVFFLKTHGDDSRYELLDLAEEPTEGITREIEDQAAVLRCFQAEYGSRPWPCRDRVRLLVKQLADPDNSYLACVRLEELGPEALPAIILEMATGRKYAEGTLSLAAPPSNPFEAIYHLNLNDASEALRVIASLLAGRSNRRFGNPSDPPSAQSWAIYLTHFKVMKGRLMGRVYVPKIVPRDMPQEAIDAFLSRARADWAER